MRDSLFVCKRLGEYKEVRYLLAEAQNRAARLQAIAKKPPPPPWYPSGWKRYSATIVWRENNDCDNSYWDCFGIDVMTKNGCSSLFATIQLLDAEGRVVDTTTDLINSLGPRDIGKLDFSVLDEGVQSARLFEVDCY